MKTPTERLWAGPFGDAYIERNRHTADGRERFWADILGRYPVRSALEVGCNVGPNLGHFPRRIAVAGVDVNEQALEIASQSVPDARLARCSALELDHLFDAGAFELVFTAGVLIHIAPNDLERAMTQIARASSRYVLAVEYADEELVEVPYRGERNALWRAPYGRLYQRLGLELVDSAYLEERVWDRSTYWLLRKPS